MHFFLSVSLLFSTLFILEATESWKSDEPIANFHIKANYSSPEAGTIKLQTGTASISLKTDENSNGIVEFIASQKVGNKGQLKAFRNGEQVGKLIEFGVKQAQTGSSPNYFVSSEKQSKETFDFSQDFTAYVKFKTKGNGTLFSMAIPEKKWIENGKVLYLDNGKLIYDIGWKGKITSRNKVNDNKWHEAVLVTNSGNVSLYLDGKLILSENNFSAEKANGSLFQIGQCSVDFGGNFEGNISNVRYWKRALDDKEAILASSK